MSCNDRSQVTDHDVQAYIDGQIVPGTAYARDVEAYMAAKPEALARARDYERQNDAIRTRYQDILAERAPERLEPASIRAATASSAGAFHSSRLRVVAGVAGIGCAALIGWIAGQSVESPLEQFTERTMVYLSERGNESAPDSHNAYQSARVLGGVPDLKANGLDLVGARRVENGEMYEALYEDNKGRRAHLIVAPDPQRHNELIHRTREDGQHVIYWQQGPLMYALTGDFSESDLDTLATTAIKDSGKSPGRGQFAGSHFKGAGGVADSADTREPTGMPPLQTSQSEPIHDTDRIPESTAPVSNLVTEPEL